MTERGIIFTGESVRAILAGRKTQTRRVVKPNRNDGTFILLEMMDGGWWPYRSRDGESCYPYGCEVPYSAPYGGEGSRLYVKETWRPSWHDDIRACVEYRADGAKIKPTITDEGVGFHFFGECDASEPTDHWRPSIFMPRWASRITLDVVAVRVEPLQSISAADIGAEGFALEGTFPACMTTQARALRDGFATGWDSINAKRAPWASNLWVWVVEFRRVT